MGKVTNCANTGEINGIFEVGGIIGYCYLGDIDITSCRNSGKITINNPQGCGYAGGIVGYITYKSIRNPISDCKNDGSVIASDNESAVGDITGYSNIVN